jgi:hypothetical protein
MSGENLVNINYLTNFLSNFPLMRLFTICLLFFGFGLFLTGETWLRFKKANEQESSEDIAYHIQGDTIQIRVPIAIPYLNQSLETNTPERVIFVENAYFLVTRTYFSQDTLYTEGHRIQPSRQEMFSILGQLVQLGQDKEPSPLDRALDVCQYLAKFYQLSSFSWIQWFWYDWLHAPHAMFVPFWRSLPQVPLCLPPSLVK